MSGRTKRGPKRGPTLRRKHLILDQAKIDRAKRILRAATETETIDRALETVSDLARFQVEVDAGLDRVLGRRRFVDFFGVTQRSQ